MGVDATDVFTFPDTAVTPATAVLRDRGEERNHQALVAEVRSCVRRLHALGVRPGDRVLLKGTNSAAFVVTLLALAHADASVILVDHSQDEGDTLAITQLTGAEWFLTDGAPPLAGTRHIHYPDLLAGATALSPPRGVGNGSHLSLELQPWWQREDAVILCSSGSTGRPKCVVRSGRSLLDNTLRTIGALSLSSDEVLAPWLPYSHQYGLSVLLSWWLAGATLSVVSETRPDRAAACALADRATIVEATPSTYRTLLRLAAARPELRQRLRSVTSWGVGGEPLPRSVADEFERVIGAPLLDGYGLTEAGNVAIATTANPVGCGRPLPGVDLRVVDETGRVMPRGSTGGIEVKTTDLMTGYLAAGGVLERPSPGWYATGDLGFVDPEGNVHVVGRRSAVHRRGYTLYPEEISRRAEECGRPVQVIPVEDDRRGCLLIFAVCDPSGASADHWRRRFRELLPRYEHPNQVRVLDEFPTTPNGKIDRARLRATVTANR